MSAAIQIRDVPEGTQDVLRRRAAEAGLSLSAYLRRVLEREASRPTLDDVLRRDRPGAPGVTMRDIVALQQRDRARDVADEPGPS